MAALLIRLLSVASAVVDLAASLVRAFATSGLVGRLVRHPRQHSRHARAALARRAHTLQARASASARRRYVRRHPHPASAAIAEKMSLSEHIALAICNGVGTLTCALLFMAIAFVSLPQTLATHNLMYFVQWLSGAFFQLVLLAVLQLGSNVGGRHAERRAEATYELANQSVGLLHATLELVQALESRPLPACVHAVPVPAAAPAAAPAEEPSHEAHAAKRERRRMSAPAKEG